MRRSAALLLLCTALLTGCGAGGGDSAGADKSSTAGRAEGPAGSLSGGTVQQAGGKAAVAVERSVIRSASLSVDVRDVVKAVQAAVAIAAEARGEVEDQSTSLDGEDYGTVVLRVPPARLTEVVDDLAALGKERQRQVDAKDVTDGVVDLESRLATQRASVARVRELLARAGSLTEITSVEAQLTSREADLESLQNRLAALRGQADLATVTLTVREQGSAPGSALGFLDGLRGGWTAVTVVARALAVTAGALLPFSPLLLVALAARWAVRRRRVTPVTPT